MIDPLHLGDRVLPRLNKALLILNPGSGARRGRLRWADWLADMRRQGIELDCRETRTLDDARRLVRETDHVDLVVAVGGDGTVNGVLSGLMDVPEPRPALAVLYTGTSPDFCRFQGIPLDPAQALAAILARRTRAVDIARIQFHDGAGAPRTACFSCSANIGIGAHAAARANRWRPWLGEYAGTALAVLSTLADPRRNFTVQFDAAPPILLPNCCNLTIAKNPLIASGLKIDSPLAPDDGTLAAVAVYDLGLAGLLKLFPAFYTGRIPACRGVFRTTCRRVQITADRDCPLEFDGDPHGYLPVTIEILPRALHLVVGSDPAVGSEPIAEAA